MFREDRHAQAFPTAWSSWDPNAVTKLGTGEYQYEIDYDYGKGCGLCVAECPSGAIEMEPEPS